MKSRKKTFHFWNNITIPENKDKFEDLKINFNNKLIALPKTKIEIIFNKKCKINETLRSSLKNFPISKISSRCKKFDTKRELDKEIKSKMNGDSIKKEYAFLSIKSHDRSPLVPNSSNYRYFKKIKNFRKRIDGDNSPKIYKGNKTRLRLYSHESTPRSQFFPSDVNQSLLYKRIVCLRNCFKHRIRERNFPDVEFIPSSNRKKVITLNINNYLKELL